MQQDGIQGTVIADFCLDPQSATKEKYIKALYYSMTLLYLFFGRSKTNPNERIMCSMHGVIKRLLREFV